MVESLKTGGPKAPSRPRKSQLPAEPVAPDAPSSRASGDRLLLGKVPPAPARPTPISPDGNLDYYRKRHLDFQARHPDLTPPTYYLNYGDVYVRRFTEVLSPELSKQGQEWMVRARQNLQVAIETELARNPEIEKDDAAFTAFAYETHSRAYLDAGLTDLPIDDLIRVAVTPNLSDTLNSQGLAVIASTAEVVARDKLAQAMGSPKELAQEVLNAIKTSPDLMGDVIMLLGTAENRRTLLDGLAKARTWPREVATSLMTQLWDATMTQFKQAAEKWRSLLTREPEPEGAG